MHAPCFASVYSRWNVWVQQVPSTCCETVLTASDSHLLLTDSYKLSNTTLDYIWMRVLAMHPSIHSKIAYSILHQIVYTTAQVNMFLFSSISIFFNEEKCDWLKMEDSFFQLEGLSFIMFITPSPSRKTLRYFMLYSTLQYQD